jgi:hypothetical protein
MLTVLIGMAPASAAAGGSAVASVPAGSAFTIRNSAANKCAGLADGGSSANGTDLVLWDCHLHADQWWYGDGNLWRSTASGKCVGLADGGSTANGTRLVLWNCHYHANQQWMPVQ